MSLSRLETLKIKAKLLQKAKRKAGKLIQLKEAFEMIAKTAGYGSWRQLKATVEKHELLSPPGSKAYWNVWYSSYDEASAHLREQGGFLLPFEKDFFICDLHYIEGLGVGKGDPDLEKVGPDWVVPRDEKALARLLKKIKAARCG